jgi:hypothetical protein
MTAQPSRRRPLVLVPRSDDTAEAVVHQWDPEAQLVGALMHLPVSTVAPILTVVPDSAIWLPDTRWAMEIIRHLVTHNIEPDPVTLLHTARGRGPFTSGEWPVSARRHHRFALHLAHLYTQAVSPALVRQFAREVLEDAFRRAVGAYGARLAQMAENGAGRDELAHCVSTMRTELADWWRRTEAARPAVSNP